MGNDIRTLSSLSWLIQPEHIRRAIYPSIHPKIIAAAHTQVRKIIKPKGAFPKE
jgi:hypothetical protein